MTSTPNNSPRQPAGHGPELSHNGRVAVSYIRAGYHVFPLDSRRAVHKPEDRLPRAKCKKSPLVKWSVNATTDEGQIRKWWTKWPNALVAIPCKQNNLFLIDADRHTNEQNGIEEFDILCAEHDNPLPLHPVVETEYEGQHHLFTMPDPPIGNKKYKESSGIETRGFESKNCGGYFVAAGSMMPDGYGWTPVKGTPSLLEGRPPLPPQWLADLFRVPEPIQPSPAPAKMASGLSPGRRERNYALRTLNRVARELAAMHPNTGRDDKLVEVACTCGRQIRSGWIDATTVENDLVAACKDNGLSDEIGIDQIRDKIARAIEASTAHPPLPDKGRASATSTGATADDAKVIELAKLRVIRRANLTP
jgi:putative DNA primase/helicase